MEGVLRIVQHTPLWVFAVFVVLLVFGVQALKPRILPIWRLLIVPAVFILWGVVSVVARSATFPIPIVDWLITAAIGSAIAWLTTRLDGVQIDHATGCVRVPGSAVPLIRNLVIFAAKYCLTAAMTISPLLQGTLAPWDVGISGISAGYFIGWLLRLALKYREKARPQSPAPRQETTAG